MKDIVDELRAQCREAHRLPAEKSAVTVPEPAELDDVRWRASVEIEQLRQRVGQAWQSIASAPKDEGPLLLFCPGLAGHVADEIVVGTWRFDANRRALGYWVSDVGQLDTGFAETGPWIEYLELHPEGWTRLPARPSKGS